MLRSPSVTNSEGDLVLGLFGEVCLCAVAVGHETLTELSEGVGFAVPVGRGTVFHGAGYGGFSYR